MRKRPLFLLIALLSAGCNRQDADGLERIGHKVLERTQAAVSPLREKFDDTVKGFGSSSGSGLHERVQRRLQWDKALADVAIEVTITDHEVELKGKLKSAEQRRRAVELTETTAGVERVTDHLEVE